MNETCFKDNAMGTSRVVCWGWLGGLVVFDVYVLSQKCLFVQARHCTGIL